MLTKYKCPICGEVGLIVLAGSKSYEDICAGSGVEHIAGTAGNADDACESSGMRRIQLDDGMAFEWPCGKCAGKSTG